LCFLRIRLIWLKDSGLGRGFLTFGGLLAALAPFTAVAAIAVTAAAFAWLAFLALFLAFRTRLNLGGGHRCGPIARLVQRG
jgi:hypothetical protein